MARLLGLFSSDRLAKEMSAVTRVIVILQERHGIRFVTFLTHVCSNAFLHPSYEFILFFGETIKETTTKNKSEPEVCCYLLSFKPVLEEVKYSLLHHIGNLVAFERGSDEHYWSHGRHYFIGRGRLRLQQKTRTKQSQKCRKT